VTSGRSTIDGTAVGGGRETNPLYSSQSRLQLGTFSTNTRYGGAITKLDGTLDPTWENVLDAAKVGDDARMEAIVPVARWRGCGGTTDFGGSSLEPFTWAAGLTAWCSAPRSSPPAICR